jgi:hypothetical protein
MYFNAWDNEETCPECGSEHAKLSQGLFDLADETVRIISAPDITHAMLAAIRETTNDLASGRIAPDDAIKRLKKINPSIARLFRKAFSKGNSFLTVLSVIASLACLYYASYQTDLAKEQTLIAREQLDLQKRTPDPTMVLERILEKLFETTVKSEPAAPQHDIRNKRRAHKAKSRPKPKSVPVNRVNPQKPKVRQ